MRLAGFAKSQKIDPSQGSHAKAKIKNISLCVISQVARSKDTAAVAPDQDREQVQQETARHQEGEPDRVQVSL